MLINDIIRKHKKDGAPAKTISETWEHLQVRFFFQLAELEVSFSASNSGGLNN